MEQSNKFIFDCKNCTNLCDGVSKGTYIFMDDVEYSELKEKLLINKINTVEGFFAKKCEEDDYPDVEVHSKKNDTTFFVEVKCQRRTFMAVERKLPKSDLKPSETVALNLSDLLRYFNIRKQTNANIFILWCVENRPCIVEPGKTKYYYQYIDKLEEIYNYYKEKRKFKRKSGKGDVDQYGNHKGVVVNYHFSLNELKELHLLELLKEGEN